MRASQSIGSRLRPLALAMVALFSATGSRAGLFDDDDARRAILEMRQQRTQDADTLTARFKELNDQIDVLKRSLLDMNAQIELVRGDLAKERGKNEVLARDLAEVQRKQKELQQAADDRARKLEPISVNLDGKSFKAEPDEKRLYDDALTKFKAQDFAATATFLNTLLQRYPSTGYRESANYWLGNAYYGAAQYNEAIASFKQLVSAAPEHPRTPEAMLSIATCFGELKDAKQSRKTLEELIKQFPQSEAAQVAKERVSALTTKEPEASASTASATTGKAKSRK